MSTGIGLYNDCDCGDVDVPVVVDPDIRVLKYGCGLTLLLVPIAD